MAWEKPTEEMLEVFAKAIPRHPPIDKKKMFGCPVGFVNGNMFLGLHQNRIVLRLSEEDRENFIKSYRATIFEPMPGRQMKEYVVVPETMTEQMATLRNWTARSFEYAASLPPKRARGKKNTPSKSKTKKTKAKH